MTDSVSPAASNEPIEVGVVEVLLTRIYKLDPENDSPNATTVVVEPGNYPLFSDGMSFFWLMRGRVNAGRCFRRMGDGMFAVEPTDRPVGPEVQFPSKTFGRDEWDDFTANDPTCAEHHPQQRLRVHRDGTAASHG